MASFLYPYCSPQLAEDLLVHDLLRPSCTGRLDGQSRLQAIGFTLNMHRLADLPCLSAGLRLRFESTVNTINLHWLQSDHLPMQPHWLESAGTAIERICGDPDQFWTYVYQLCTISPALPVASIDQLAQVVLNVALSDSRSGHGHPDEDNPQLLNEWQLANGYCGQLFYDLERLKGRCDWYRRNAHSTAAPSGAVAMMERQRLVALVVLSMVGHERLAHLGVPNGFLGLELAMPFVQSLANQCMALVSGLRLCCACFEVHVFFFLELFAMEMVDFYNLCFFLLA